MTPIYFPLHNSFFEEAFQVCFSSNVSMVYIFKSSQDPCFNVLILKCFQDQCFNVVTFQYSQDGQTVLHVAASAGRLETVEALLDRGCDSNVQDFVSFSSSFVASSSSLLSSRGCYNCCHPQNVIVYRLSQNK